MKRAPLTPARARRTLATGLVMLAALAFAAANFVLVDVHLLVIGFETRLAWAVLVPAVLAFVAGWRCGRRPKGSDGEPGAE